jgi:dihydroflavonol-4-reductase
MRVLITGATGFIGSHLCRALAKAGYTTRALIRSTSSLSLIEDLDLDLAVGDLMDPGSLEAAMRGIEVVIHCGAEVGGWRDRESMVASHIVGTENILNALARSDARRLLYTSSVAALGVPDPAPSGQDPVPMDEHHQWNYDPDDWAYGYAKHCAEQTVLKATATGLDALILNPAAVIGAGDKNLVASAIVYHMGRGLRPPIPPGGLNVVHIEDVVAGYVAAIEHGRSGERYILGGENVGFEAFLQEIASVVGTSPLRVRLPRRFFNRIAGVIDYLQPILKFPVRGHLFRMAGRHFYYDTTKASVELGLSSTRTTRESIQAAHDWYGANPTLIRAPDR